MYHYNLHSLKIIDRLPLPDHMGDFAVVCPRDNQEPNCGSLYPGMVNIILAQLHIRHTYVPPSP